MSSCSFLATLIIVLSLGPWCFSADPIIIDFGPESKDMFVSEEGCKGDEFTVEEYKKDPVIHSPQSSNGYYLRIRDSGCLATRSLHLEPDSQIKMYYRIIDPGVELKIIVGDNILKPILGFGGWRTFIEDLSDVPDNAQVKLLSTFVGDFSFVAIDRIEITPRPSTINETITDATISLELSTSLEVTTFPAETASPEVTTPVQEITSPKETASAEATTSPEGIISPQLRNSLEDTTFPEETISSEETIHPEETTSQEGINSPEFRNSMEERISPAETVSPENPEFRLGPAMKSVPIRASNNVHSSRIDHFRAKLIRKDENVTVNTRMERIDRANMNFWKPVSLTAISIAILLILILFALSMFLFNTECI